MKKFVVILLTLCLVFALTACGGKTETNTNSTKTVDLPAVYAGFGLNSEDMLPLAETDLMEYYGIDAANVKQFAGAVNLTGISAEEIVLIEAVDANAAASVKAQLDARYDSKAAQMKDYLPDQYAIIEKCSVRVDGNFVAMIVSENAETYVAAYEAAIK